MISTRIVRIDTASSSPIRIGAHEPEHDIVVVRGGVWVWQRCSRAYIDTTNHPFINPNLLTVKPVWRFVDLDIRR